MANKNLNKAKEAKKDEFYTQLEDINNELRHYREHFRDKTVLCNCDDPRVSNFFTYFAYNFEFLGLKKLITTCYKNQDIDLFSQNKSEQAVYLVYEGDISIWRRWKPTTSRHGKRAARRWRKTARCFAGTATGSKEGNKPSQPKGSSTTRSASTGLRRKMEADSTNFSGLSVVRKRQVPPCVHRASMSA